MPGPAASFQRRRLREALRAHREHADLTQEQAAKAVEWSISKIIRIEAGSVGVSVSDLRSLLSLYVVTDAAQVEELLTLARSSRRRSWLSPYRDMLAPGFVTFAELESDASELRYFQEVLLPGLVQTRAYAFSCITAALAATGRHGNITTLVDIRLRRQREVLDQARPPEIYFVLDEAVLRRVVHSEEVMRAQLRELVELSTRDFVHTMVIPFSHGVHAGSFGPFVIMDFPGPDARSILYQEGAFTDQIVRDKPEMIAAYRKTFDQLANGALAETDSLAFIKRIADEMR